MLSYLVLFVLTGCAGLTSACQEYSTCSSCLQASPECVWCSEQDNAYCFERGMSNCSADNIEDLTGSFTATEADPSENVNVENVIIRARPGETNRFNVTIRIPFNYPLDVYYLMDFSCSMHDDLAAIKTLSTDIVNVIKNLTTDFRLGFGAYSDKLASPYSLTRTPYPWCGMRVDFLDFTSDLVQQTAPFNFIHFQSLTNDAELFVRAINNQTITSNIDLPESLFDALMQVASCPEVIGWRPASSHIVIVATDAPFHLAGEGKMAGALRPNDAQCHLIPSERGEYTYSLGMDLDYPSIGQITESLRQQRIVPIFAISGTASRRYYNQLAVYLQDGQVDSFVSSLSADSTNILQLIEDGYNALAQEIQLTFPTLPGVEISVTPFCRNISGSACTDIRRGDNATFEISVAVTNCSLARRGFQNFSLDYAFLAIEVQVALEALCECECETDSTRENNSAVCNSKGDLVCGQCVCDDNRFAANCECSLPLGADPMQQGNGHNMCPIGDGGLMCSGRGTCECNMCMCTQANYTGDACEEMVCFEEFCPRDENNQICGGPDQGVCSCNGTCSCVSGYTDSDCSCPTSLERCTDSEDVICLNRGACVCGACECNSEYSGALCERCINPPCPGDATCTTVQHCAVCELVAQQLIQADPVDNCDQLRCSTPRPRLYEASSAESVTINGYEAEQCNSQDDRGCTYTYYFAEDESRVLQQLYISSNVACPSGGSSSSDNLVWIIPVAIIAGLIILGIIVLVIIKLILMALDYVEVKRFERSVRDAEGKLTQTSQPLYQSPVVEYSNPAYGKEKKQQQQSS